MAPGTGHRSNVGKVIVRAVWFCTLLICIVGVLGWSALVSFPRAGASKPLGSTAAFCESVGILIMQVADAPFLWLDRFLRPGTCQSLTLVFWATLLYLVSALLHRPRWVFRCNRGARTVPKE